MTNKILKFVLFSLIFFGLSGLAQAQEYQNQRECIDAGYPASVCCDIYGLCTPTTPPPANTTPTNNPAPTQNPPPSLPTNRTDSPASSNNGNCTTDDFCKGDFCRINGVCVPAPKANQGGLIGATSIFGAIQLVITWLLTFAGIIATIFLVIGGYQYITAAGNEEQSEKGKKTIMNSIFGIVVVVLAITIVTIVTNTLGQNSPLG